MDAAPRRFAELDTDPELGIPVPFACGVAVYGASEVASARSLDGRRVTQCALSRVCGVCGATLGRPLAFLGSRTEADRNAFHFPACHLRCARGLRAAVEPLSEPVLGHDEAVEEWVLLTTAAFEFVRPSKEDLDRRPTFQPHQVADVPAGP
ncbi:MAG TPA: hypothetical protein VFE07_16510 [Marmoricola sp.]|jgi:hypothetical protein|nr:hypothetical protein [Marmoricola sp.]